MKVATLFLLFIYPRHIFAASGGGVRYNCVNGTNKAECAQICENFKVSVGDLPDPLAGFHLTLTPVQVTQYRQNEIPYYCDGIPVTQQQKDFTNQGKIIAPPTSKPSQQPTNVITITSVPTITVPTAPPLIPSSNISNKSILSRIINWFISFIPSKR